MFGKSKSSKKNSNISRSCICRLRIPTADPRPDDLKTTCENCPRDLIDLNQKYLNLRRQREELYRLLRGAFRLVRVRVEMDKYFVQHDEYLRGLNELHSTAKKRYPDYILDDWQEAVAAITTRLNEHHNKIKEMFLRKKRLAEQEKQVTFEKSSVSSFTSVTGEEENLGASNVVELPKPNQDVRPKNSTPLETESSEKRNSEHLDSQVTPKSTFKSYLDAEEAAHVEMRRKERQRESVEKRAELKRKNVNEHRSRSEPN